MNRPSKPTPPGFEPPRFVLRAIDEITEPELIRYIPQHEENPLYFEASIFQQGELKFYFEVALYVDNKLIAFVHGLPGLVTIPTDPGLGDTADRIVDHALNEWGKDRLFS